MKRLLASVAVLALAACGGGGGGSATPAAGGGSTPITTPTTAPIQTSGVQRTLVQQSLTSTDQSSQIASFGSSSGSSSLALRRAVADMRATTSISCINGTETSITTTGNPNVDDVTIAGFYNASCTELWYSSSGTLTATSSTAGTVALVTTYYTLTGSVYRYVPLTLSLTGIGTGSGTFALQASLANSSGASPFANVGVGCSIAPTADACSLAEADHLAGLGADVAVGVNVAATLSSANGGGVIIGLSGNGVADVGSLNATSVVSTGTYTFGISGGSTVDAAGLAGSLTLTPAGLIVGGSLALSDAADGATVSAVYNAGSQTISGAVTLNATGATVASYSVNLQGTGTLTYGNGTMGTISNWVVQS
jgi:hypothetical protein